MKLKQHFLIIIFFVLFLGLSRTEALAKEQLAYSQFTEKYWQIWVMDEEGKRKKQITFSPQDKREPTWMDANTILFRTTNGKLFYVDIKKSQEIQILKKFHKIYQPYYVEAGKQIFFHRPDPRLRNATQLWSCDVDGNNMRQLTKEGEFKLYPTLNPKADTMLFVMGDKGGNNHHLWTSDRDGQNAKVLTKGKGFDAYPVFTADGQNIIYSSSRYSGNYDIYKMNIKSKKFVSLTDNPSSDVHPTISSDGQKIIFISNRSGTQQIWRMDQNGLHLKQLTNGPSEALEPSFYMKPLKEEQKNLNTDPSVFNEDNPVVEKSKPFKKVIASAINFDSATGQYLYTLPEDALVRLRVGLENHGPLLRTLVDWKERKAGQNVEKWNMRDEKGVVKFAMRKDLIFTLSAVALKNDYSINTFKKMKGYGQEPRFQIELPTSKTKTKEGAYNINGIAPIQIILNEKDKTWLTDARYGIVLFIDNIFIAEEKEGQTPFTYMLNTNHLKNGRHILTANIWSYEGEFSTQSIYIDVHNE